MRRVALAVLFALACAGLQAQQPALLKITVTVVDADGHVRPVPRHALLISDNPATAAPQRVVTSADGTIDVRLRPGNYTIESDAPLVFQGKSYEWTETIDVAPGRDAVLDLSAAKAQVAAATTAAAAVVADDKASALLLEWQDSIVWIWSPTRLGSGFLIDARGLILTSRHVVGDATQVEVQLSPSSKVAARVLVSDADKDVAVLWIDPSVVRAVRPMPLGSIAEHEKVYAIDAPYHDRKGLESGTVSKATAKTIVSDVRLATISAGVPLQNAAGEAVALTTLAGETADDLDVADASVRIDEARPAIAAAEAKMRGASPPGAGALPTESERPFDDDALREMVKSRGGNVAPYHLAAADFDVYFITPVHLYAERHQPERGDSRASSGKGMTPEQVAELLSPVRDFENWTDYAADYPPVVMLRVRPKFVESFWTTIARGAASTQGVAIPAIKHMKTSLTSLTLRCGAAAVTPVHALTIVRHMPGNTTIDEALYVFDPSAIGSCAGGKITLVSQKNPGKPDVRAIDPKILQQVQDDFAPWRAASR
jgi:hypothetical protein